MIVTIEQFQKYSNVYIENTELQEYYLLSAQNIINDYVGYEIENNLLNPKTGELEEITDINEIPEIIKITLMRIAAILQTESDGNVGITSKSFADSGSRTFMNYTNFDKFLTPISNYRIIRI